MSRCQKSHLLEAAVAGEAPDDDLRGHAEECARCRHELRWLETEQSVFRQRAARQEVDRLWQGVERVSVSSKRSRRTLIAAAAAFLLVLGGGRELSRFSPAQPHEAPQELEALMTLNAFSVDRHDWCSTTVNSTVGFHCGGYVLASR